jgi:hypothetical protein
MHQGAGPRIRSDLHDDPDRACAHLTNLDHASVGFAPADEEAFVHVVEQRAIGGFGVEEPKAARDALEIAAARAHVVLPIRPLDLEQPAIGPLLLVQESL